MPAVHSDHRGWVVEWIRWGKNSQYGFFCAYCCEEMEGVLCCYEYRIPPWVDDETEKVRHWRKSVPYPGVAVQKTYDCYVAEAIPLSSFDEYDEDRVL